MDRALFRGLLIAFTLVAGCSKSQSRNGDFTPSSNQEFNGSPAFIAQQNGLGAQALGNATVGNQNGKNRVSNGSEIGRAISKGTGGGKVGNPGSANKMLDLKEFVTIYFD